MMKLFDRKKKILGNKGFSLVELIIVIAIMAVLIAVLAPQYIKYVEKSRVQADETYAGQLLDAVNVMLSDPDLASTIDQGFTVTWTNVANSKADTIVVAGTPADAALETAVKGGLTEVLGIDFVTAGANTHEIKSNAHALAADDIYVVTVTMVGTVLKATVDWT